MSEWLRCIRCGKEFDAGAIRYTCDCEGLLSVERDAPSVGPSVFDSRRDRATGIDRSGVWRFREAVLDVACESIVTHPEGSTRMYEREGIFFKHEGENPTGSFKDRGMTVAVTQAMRLGSRAVACASTGNTSASLAAYAAQAGLKAIVFVPAGKVSAGKLAQTLAYGARTLLVRGGFDDCLRLVQEASERLGVYLLNSINPFRLEGQKTIVLELLQQLGWDPPDWIVLPAGNLGNTAAFGKAIREAHAWGLIGRRPRLAAVQAAGAAPFARSFEEGFRQRYRVEPETVATAIRIGDPASHDRAVRAIRETDGVVLAVSDAEILEAKAAVDACGVGCEPASAASIAGVRTLVRRGTIPSGARVVAVLTGHVLKDPGMLLQYHVETDPPPSGANRPVEIEADLREVERELTKET